MVEIHVHHSVNGYRTYITHGRHISVVDGNLAADSSHLRTTDYHTNYMYGT